MRIVLIEASEVNIFNIFQMHKMPRLGLPIIGKILTNLGHRVIIYIENISPIDWEEVFSADLVGISALTPTAPRAYEIAEKIRAKGKNISICGGGPHFTFLPDEALDHFFDYVVRGEGEKTMVELVNWLENPKPAAIKNISGLSYRIGQNIFHNPGRPFMSSDELNLLPAPDLNLIRGYKIKELIPMQTSRGCPFGCEFCSVQIMWGREYRFRSVDNVIKELEELTGKFPQAKIFFYDDNFAASLPRAKTLLKEILHRNIKFTWQTQMRVKDTEDSELMKLMSLSGCKWLFFGLESINPKTLKDYKKSQTVADIIQGIKIIREFGIKALGMFVVGGDSDVTTTAKETVKFAEKNKIDAIQLWALGPLPGTRVYNKLKAQGRLLFEELGVKKWRLYDGIRVVIKPQNMTAWQLQVSIAKAMASYYGWRWFGKSLATTLKFISFRSWKDIKSQAESLVLSIYALRLTNQAKEFLKKHLADLKKLA
ncbi:MAG: radical SAM protein [Candidatus Moranbacteria bacterium]|nr:radical SAM protein [Candidatus Moranbacteria bacterium]